MTFLIDQAFYGSTTGRSNYQILAHSAGVAPDELRVLEDYANLGGSAISGEPPGPILAFYRLKTGAKRFVLSGTDFLKKGARGNDYLTHLLLIDPDTLAKIKGNIVLLTFLLKSHEAKPVDRTLAPIHLAEDEYLEKGRQPGKTYLKQGFSDELLAFMLARLGDGSVGALSSKPSENRALCQTLLALLPPDDREKLSFTTHYAHPRKLDFRLALYPKADADLAYSYLTESQHVRRPEWRADEEERKANLFKWIEWIQEGLPPVFGLSVFADDGVAVANALGEARQAWKIHPDLNPFRELAPDVRAKLLKVCRDRYNLDVTAVADLHEMAIVASFRERMEKHVGQGDEAMKAIEKDVANMRKAFPPTPERVASFVHALSGERIAGSVTARLVLLLSYALAVDAEAVYSERRQDALMRGPEEAAETWHTLFQSDDVLAKSLLNLWIMRTLTGDFADLVALISAYKTLYPRRVTKFWNALYRGLLDYSSGLGVTERPRFLVSIVLAFRPKFGELFTQEEVLDLIVEHDLYANLSVGQAENVVKRLLGDRFEYVESLFLKDRPFNHATRDQLGVLLMGLADRVRINSRASEKSPLPPAQRNLSIKALDLAVELLAEESNQRLATSTQILVWALVQNLVLDRISRQEHNKPEFERMGDYLEALLKLRPKAAIEETKIALDHIRINAGRDKRRQIENLLQMLQHDASFTKRHTRINKLLPRILTSMKSRT